MLRVLVVEDDIVLADLLAKGLREHEMVVDVVHDGVDAVNRAFDVIPDVIVLDRDLPILHGDDVTRALIRQVSAS
jgi:DNA-binding response OmpR family regulator